MIRHSFTKMLTSFQRYVTHLLENEEFIWYIQLIGGRLLTFNDDCMQLTLRIQLRFSRF